MRDSMVFYKSFYDAVKDLPPKQFKEAMSAICEYAFDGKDDVKNATAKTVLALVRPQIDKNNKRYENGKHGGRPASESVKKNQFTKIENCDTDFEEMGRRVFKNI